VETWIRRLLTEGSFKRLRKCADEKNSFGRGFCISRDNATLMYSLEWLEDFVLDALVEQIFLQEVDDTCEIPPLEIGTAVIIDGMKAELYNGKYGLVIPDDDEKSVDGRPASDGRIAVHHRRLHTLPPDA